MLRYAKRQRHALDSFKFPANVPQRGTAVHKVCYSEWRMRVRLIRKHAERIDGVDLRGCEPGDVLDVSAADGRLLIAEQWAMPERRELQQPCSPTRREDDFNQHAVS